MPRPKGLRLKKDAKETKKKNDPLPKLPRQVTTGAIALGNISPSDIKKSKKQMGMSLDEETIECNLKNLAKYLDWRTPQLSKEDINLELWTITAIVWEYLPEPVPFEYTIGFSDPRKYSVIDTPMPVKMAMSTTGDIVYAYTVKKGEEKLGDGIVVTHIVLVSRITNIEMKGPRKGIQMDLSTFIRDDDDDDDRPECTWWELEDSSLEVTHIAFDVSESIYFTNGEQVFKLEYNIDGMGGYDKEPKILFSPEEETSSHITSLWRQGDLVYFSVQNWEKEEDIMLYRVNRTQSSSVMGMLAAGSSGFPGISLTSMMAGSKGSSKRGVSSSKRSSSKRGSSKRGKRSSKKDDPTPAAIAAMQVMVHKQGSKKGIAGMSGSIKGKKDIYSEIAGGYRVRSGTDLKRVAPVIGKRARSPTGPRRMNATGGTMTPRSPRAGSRSPRTPRTPGGSLIDSGPVRKMKIFSLRYPERIWQLHDLRFEKKFLLGLAATRMGEQAQIMHIACKKKLTVMSVHPKSRWSRSYSHKWPHLIIQHKPTRTWLVTLPVDRVESAPIKFKSKKSKKPGNTGVVKRRRKRTVESSKAAGIKKRGPPPGKALPPKKTETKTIDPSLIAFANVGRSRVGTLTVMPPSGSGPSLHLTQTSSEKIEAKLAAAGKSKEKREFFIQFRLNSSKKKVMWRRMIYLHSWMRVYKWIYYDEVRDVLIGFGGVDSKKNVYKLGFLPDIGKLLVIRESVTKSRKGTASKLKPRESIDISRALVKKLQTIDDDGVQSDKDMD